VIVHVVTDRARICGPGADRREVRDCLCRQAEYAISAGVDAIQIREPGLEAGELAALVEKVVALAAGTATRVVVNDRLDVALACGAGGVHLRHDSFPPSVARSHVPRGFLVGCSVHSVAEAMAAAPSADYLIAGTVWPSASKPGDQPLLAPDGLTAIAEAVGVPVLAIGGVTLDRVTEVARAGAAGIAAIGLFLSRAAGDHAPRCRAVPLVARVADARRRFDTSQSAS
jgi:thiamine-phosphate pyrophosphorylase